MSSQRANSRSMAPKMAVSACSMPPSVSSENTPPKPKVSSGAFRSHTVISCDGSSCLARAEKYRPPGPPPTIAMRTAPPLSSSTVAKDESLDLAGAGAGQVGDELDRARVLVRRDACLDELLQLRA